MDLDRLKIARKLQGGGRRRGSVWIFRFALLGLLLLGIWLFRSPLIGWLDQLRLPEVEVTRVVESNPAKAAAISGAAANGYIVARKRAALSVDTPGRIVALNVREGQAVKKGFVVARLYADEYAASLRRAEADLSVGNATLKRAKAEKTSAEADLRRLEATRDRAQSAVREASANEELARVNYDRTQRLVEEKVESQQQLDEKQSIWKAARARLESAKANLAAAGASLAKGRSQVAVAAAKVEESQSNLLVLEASRDLARATLEKTEIRAPFDGVVVLKDAEVGEVVSPNSQAGSNARGSVATMVDFASLEVQAEVPETTLKAVKLHAPARIFLDAFPNQPYRGRVDRIWPTANRQKATIEVRVVFEEPDDKLRPEMGVRVVFVADDSEAEATVPGDDAVLIAADAVVRIEGRDHVFVVERDVARLRPVELGGRRADRVVVKKGLAAGEAIVRRPLPSLRDSDRIRVKRAP